MDIYNSNDMTFWETLEKVTDEWLLEGRGKEELNVWMMKSFQESETILYEIIKVDRCYNLSKPMDW
jgi:hypothetical protein